MGSVRLKKKSEQNPAWSDEDEKIIDDLTQTISQYTVFVHREPKEIIQWLKSLKPHWKPTDEQMEALEKLIVWDDELYDENSIRTIESLYNDLKKL